MNNILNFRKPIFWIILSATVIVVFLGAFLFAKPLFERPALESTSQNSDKTTGTIALGSADKQGSQVDLVSGYLFIVDHLVAERDVQNRSLQYLAIDIDSLAGLNTADQARFLAGLEKYHLTILDKNLNELKAEGYIKPTGMVFENGVLFTINKINIQGSIMTMDASVYFAGLNAFGLLDFDITYNGSSWTITRTSLTWVA